MSSGRHKPSVVSWEEYIDPDSTDDPDHYHYHILAEGDSWFSIAAIPSSNLLYALRFKKMTIIANCAEPGDTIKKMGDIARNDLLKEALSRTWGKTTWDLILLSGGGNDLIDHATNIIIPKNKRATNIRNVNGYCDQEKLKKLIEKIQQGYRKIIKLRDARSSSSVGKPVITHTYDYATPRNSPVKFLFLKTPLGPWLYTAFTKRQVPDEDWMPLAKYLIDELAEGILALQRGRDKLPNFHVVDTRGTLTPAKLGHPGNSNDWVNEIHPDSDGYRKLASKKINAKLAEFLL